MDQAPYEGDDRRARRRRQQKARRRSLILGLVVIAVAAVAVAAVVMLSGRSPATGAATSPAALATSASQGSAAMPSRTSSSPASTPSPTPTPSPTRPPLDRPTKKHPLRVYFGGDSLAGLPGVLFAQHGAKSGLMKVRTDYQVASRLTNTDPVDWPARLKSQLDAGHPDVGVFMIGANDTGMPMLAHGEFTMYPKKTWLAEYQRRVRKLVTIMLRSGVKRVYWVGMPVMPSASESTKMRRLNRLFEDAAAHSPDLVYVDTYDLLATKKGGFIAALRSGDGVHFTNEGAWRIADAVWAAMKRDWRAAQ
jgi:hypothetical protein